MPSLELPLAVGMVWGLLAGCPASAVAGVSAVTVGTALQRGVGMAGAGASAALCLGRVGVVVPTS